MSPSQNYGKGLQYLSTDTPIDDIAYLLKRDSGVVCSLVSSYDLDKTYDEMKDTLEQDLEWDGEFFPKETRRANSMVARSPTYTKSQLMNPLFQAICTELLTTRNTFWPQVASCVAIEIGPGGRAQPLHCDSYISHRVVPEISEWDDERIGSERRASFIPGSHLWATYRDTPPSFDDVVVPELERGDAFIMFASVFHGGGSNITPDQRRLVYSTFVVRGYLRQEENQYLAVPREVVKSYDRATQEFIGYYISEPACGFMDQLDPIYVLYPEVLKDAKPKDF